MDPDDYPNSDLVCVWWERMDESYKLGYEVGYGDGYNANPKAKWSTPPPLTSDEREELGRLREAVRLSDARLNEFRQNFSRVAQERDRHADRVNGLVREMDELREEVSRRDKSLAALTLRMLEYEETIRAIQTAPLPAGTRRLTMTMDESER